LKEAVELITVIETGGFVIHIYHHYIDYLGMIREGLEKASRDFSSAGFPLRGKVDIVVKGKGAAQRSFFDPNTNHVQILPNALKSGDNYFTFIHELAHWYHYNNVPGKFNNGKIIEKFIWAKEEAPTKAQAVDPYDILREEIAKLELDKGKLLRMVAKGAIVEITSWDNPFTHNEKVTRKYRVIKPVPGKGGKLTEVELLNPSPNDMATIVSQGWKPPYIRHHPTSELLEATPGLKERITAVNLEIEIKVKEMNDLVVKRENTPSEAYQRRENLYQNKLSDWMPTEYARKNPREWFAELLTTRVVKPSELSDEVKKWMAQF